MKRILFVDDEQKVLDGLRRMLRPMRNEWDMRFAGGGQEALDLLSHDPVDVLVSDMRMPGIDGAELLNRIKQEYPHVVRIVLSGQSCQDAAMRTLGIAHQYLPKPCDPEVLKKTIDRACALHGVLQDERLKRVVSQTKALPSPPTVYMEIIEELKFPDASIRRIGEIIAQDAAMSAKILQLVNSAFFGLTRQVSSPVQAASFLGVETLKQLVLSVHVFSQIDPANLAAFHVDRLWEHSLGVGRLAKEIASSQDVAATLVDDAMMAGLLHDSGKLVLIQGFTDTYRQALDRARDTGVAVWEAERELMGATHAEVGAYLLGLWGLPDALVEAVAFHHRPSQSGADAFALLTAVHVANSLFHEENAGDRPDRGNQLDSDYLAKLGLTDRVASWRDAARAVIARKEERIRESPMRR